MLAPRASQLPVGRPRSRDYALCCC